MTLHEWLCQAEAQLSGGHHPERAKRDAETLLQHLTGKNKAWLIAHAEDDFAGCTAIRYAGMLERRRSGEPIQYIVGEAEFYGLPFRVTPDVLIPRPETEILVEKVIELAAAYEHPRILDVGTGSGAIPIAIAHHLAHAQITATDISGSALALASENARRNERDVRFLQGDLLAPVTGERFEIIVSNPPYVPVTDCDSLSVEVRKFEPALALFADEDGLSIYRRLIPQAFDALVPGGFVALEIGFSQQAAIQSLLASAGFTDIEFTPDLQGIPRVATARRD